MKKLILIFLLFASLSLVAQEYSNSVAVHKDSSAIVAWATSVEVVRGYINISDTSFTYTDNPSGVTSNRAFYGEPNNGTGIADGEYVSLGDGGMATLQFDSPIVNGEGPDFAVFENALLTPPGQDILSFVELAFVEVSSDGEYFARFPAVSRASATTQIGTFGAVEWNAYDNLAGNLPVFYGTPFDLDDITDENVDLNNITHIRLIDVVGSINPDYGTYDSQGNIINDPFPTPFHTSGFDLDAVGVIHSLNAVAENSLIDINVFPNPAFDYVNLSADDDFSVEIYDIMGKTVEKIVEKTNFQILNLSEFNVGIYFIAFEFENCRIVKKIEILR